MEIPMKRLAIALIPLFFCAALLIAVPGSAGAAPALEQYTKTGADPSGSSVSLTLNGVKPGSLLVVSVRASAENSPTCSDDRGGKWTTHVYAKSGYGHSHVICSSPNAAGGNTRVTVTSSGGSTYWRMILAEFSGVAASSYVTDVSQSSGSSGSANSGSVATGSDALIFFAATSDGDAWGESPGSFSPSPGYVSIDCAGKKNGAAYKVISAGTAYGTVSAGQPWTAGIVAFKTAGGSVAMPSPPLDLHLLGQ
ncbi:MAG: hypothetical protein Kow0025_05060 [Thermodesulfovibrionales bacterium]